MLLRFEYPLPIVSKCLIIVLRLAALGILALSLHFVLHPEAYSAIDANNIVQRTQRLCLLLLCAWGLAWLAPKIIFKARLGLNLNHLHYGMETLYLVLGFGITVYAIAQWQTTLWSSSYALACFLCAWLLWQYASQFNQQNHSDSEPPSYNFLPLTFFTALVLVKLSLGF